MTHSRRPNHVHSPWKSYWAEWEEAPISMAASVGQDLSLALILLPVLLAGIFLLFNPEVLDSLIPFVVEELLPLARTVIGIITSLGAL